LEDTVTIEANSGHGLSRPGHYLRQNRIKLSLWIAVVEGALVLIHVLPHLAIYILAVASVAFWAAAGRRYRSNTARQASWILAASQALTVLVPVVWFIAKGVAIVAIAAIAVVGLLFLFLERDKT
jgi:hypothetical protein